METERELQLKKDERECWRRDRGRLSERAKEGRKNERVGEIGREKV